MRAAFHRAPHLRRLYAHVNTALALLAAAVLAATLAVQAMPG